MDSYKFINPDEWMDTKKGKYDINPESYEEGSDPVYEAWKNVEQGRRLKRDVTRLSREENANLSNIIEQLEEIKQLLKEKIK